LFFFNFFFFFFFNINLCFQQLQVTQSNANRGLLNTGQASITCNKIKQQISNLQNQIAAQQAIYMKQQQQSVNSNIGGGHVGGGGMTAGDFMRPHDTIGSLQGNFTDMTLNKVIIK
jgi:trinucleotide repeat-containing gene 6 protein